MGVKVRIFQFHPSIIKHDAIGNSIDRLGSVLKSKGLEHFAICSDKLLHTARRDVIPLSAVERMDWKSNDLLIVHFSFFCEDLVRLINIPVRRVLVYHNVTPGDFFRDTEISWMSSLCDSARQQLIAVKDDFIAAVGDSDFNCKELKDMGFRNIRTIPVFYNDEIFTSAQVESDRFYNIRRSSGINAVFVGRFVPNKNHKSLVNVIAEYKRHFSENITLHLAGKVWNDSYFIDILKLSSDLGVLGNIRFHMDVSDNELIDLYSAATAFVSHSLHEGFMVPLVEAFAVGCPVIAYGGTAIGETMGGAGLMLDDTDPPLTAALLNLLSRDRELRQHVVRSQSARAAEFHSAPTAYRWFDLLSEYAG